MLDNLPLWVKATVAVLAAVGLVAISISVYRFKRRESHISNQDEHYEEVEWSFLSAKYKRITRTKSHHAEQSGEIDQLRVDVKADFKPKGVAELGEGENDE